VGWNRKPTGTLADNWLIVLELQSVTPEMLEKFVESLSLEGYIQALNFRQRLEESQCDMYSKTQTGSSK